MMDGRSASFIAFYGSPESVFFVIKQFIKATVHIFRFLEE